MPVFSALFLICLLGSVGLPGLNGFVGEFLILVGAFTHHGTATQAGIPQFIWHSALITGFAAIGVVLGAVYLLHLFQKLMFGPITVAKNASLKDLTRGEILTFIPLIVFIFWMGIYPKPFLERMEPAVKVYLKEYKLKFDASQVIAESGDKGPKAIVELLGNSAEAKRMKEDRTKALKKRPNIFGNVLGRVGR
jgi:NADH-quinone oxidoreductase subunit M